jgi:hypothetical protein
MVAKEPAGAGHPDESIQAAGVRKKMLTDLLQGNMTPAEKGHVLHVAQGNWSVTKKVRSERNQCGHSQRSDYLTAICKRHRMPGQRATVLGNSRRQSQQSRLELGHVSAIDSERGQQSGLLTHIAATESVSLGTRMKS